MIKTQLQYSLLLASSLGLLMPACGGEETAAPENKPAQRKAAKRKGNPGAPPAAGGGRRLRKINSDYRRPLSEVDFRLDSTGDINRDPFYSFVLRPGDAAKDEDAIKEEDICTKPGVRWGSKDHSYNDLRLTGIIKTGRSIALFVDKSGRDRAMVRRGDCLGREKAFVEEIGIGFVSIKVQPEAAPNPVLREIPLYPREIDIDSVIGEQAEPETAPASE